MYSDTIRHHLRGGEQRKSKKVKKRNTLQCTVMDFSHGRRRQRHLSAGMVSTVVRSNANLVTLRLRVARCVFHEHHYSNLLYEGAREM